MQFKGRGVLKGIAYVPQHHAHFEALWRGVRIHVQQHADEGFFLRLGEGRFRHHEEVDIPRRPGEAPKGNRPVDVEADSFSPRMRR